MNRTEENAFFGIPLWLFAIGATAVLWRSVVVRAAALLVLVTSWLSLGSEITLDHQPVPLPPLWPLVSRLPLFDSLLATRFTLIAVPGFAVLLVVALDRALTPRRAYAVAGRSLHPQLPLVVTVTAVAVALAPVVPTRLWVDPRPPVPVFFTSGSWEKYVDDGSVLAVPPPTSSTCGPSTGRRPRGGGSRSSRATSSGLMAVAAAPGCVGHLGAASRSGWPKSSSTKWHDRRPRSRSATFEMTWRFGRSMSLSSPA